MQRHQLVQDLILLVHGVLGPDNSIILSPSRRLPTTPGYWGREQELQAQMDVVSLLINIFGAQHQKSLNYDAFLEKFSKRNQLIYLSDQVR